MESLDEVTKKTAESLVNFLARIVDRVHRYQDGAKVIIEIYKNDRHRGSTAYGEYTVTGDTVTFENWED